MVAPIIIRNPLASLTELVDGTPTGTPVDISDDVSKVELAPTVPTTNVQTFSGKYQQAGDVEWAATATIVVNADTATNWTPLVGKSVKVKVFDRGDSPSYREFDSEIVFNPAIGGPTTPGAARTFDMVLPVLGQVAYVEGP